MILAYPREDDVRREEVEMVVPLLLLPSLSPPKMCVE